MLDLDTCKWNSTDLFKHLHKVLPKDFGQTHNIVEVKDDMLFVWNDVEKCLMTLNWRASLAKGSAVHCQRLIVSSSSSSKPTGSASQPNLSFAVTRILPSNDGTLICLSGARGVAVMELPGRWGPNGLYREGSEAIFCRTVILEEKLLLLNASLEVLTTKWHPEAANDLFVLLSDNSIRLYNEMLKLRHVWRMGGQLDQSSSRFSIDLGETAVDFDFGAPRFVQDTQGGGGCVSLLDESQQGATGNKRIEWPIYVLKGNGSVDVLSAGIDTARPLIHKDVTMLPAKKDNYGVDSCSIIAINSSSPTTLVIAESTGRLHHCIIAENSKGASEDDSQWCIYVVETIELELGLPIDPKERNYVCPVFMKRDPTNESRYFVYHNTGLHAVTIRFLSALATFVESTEDTEGSLELAEASQAEYLVCTKVAGVENANVVLGLTFLQSPAVMVLYLNSGQVLSLDLITNTGVLDQYLTKSGTSSKRDTGHYLKSSDSLANSTMKQSSDGLQKLETIKRSVAQPILHLDKSTKLEPGQEMSVLQQVISTFKENYFMRLNTIRQELDRRVKLLAMTKQQQVVEIRNLQSECELIRDNAENLAVKYEDICERQQEYTRRAQEVVRLANLHLPRNTNSEREFIEKVAAINLKTKTLAAQLVTMRTKMNQFKSQTDAQGDKLRTQTIVLPPKREQIIMEILSDSTKQIEQQMSQVKKLMQIVQSSESN